MFTFKNFTLTLILTILLGSSFLSGGNTAAGQLSGIQTPTRKSSISIHLTTPEELRAIQPIQKNERLAPELAAAVDQFLGLRIDLACKVVVGRVTVSQGDQTCTYTVVNTTACGGSGNPQVTVSNCVINEQ